MVRDTLLGFPSHSLPYRYRTVIADLDTLSTISNDPLYALYSGSFSVSIHYWLGIYKLCQPLALEPGVALDGKL